MMSGLYFVHVYTVQAVVENLSTWRIYKLTVDPIGVVFFLHFHTFFLNLRKLYKQSALSLLFVVAVLG